MKDDIRALLTAIAIGHGTAAEHRKTARALLAAEDKLLKMIKDLPEGPGDDWSY